MILVVVTEFVLARTAVGLRVRASGENPAAALGSGVNVRRVRTLVCLVSGFVAGIGGAYFTIGSAGQFIAQMSAGLGYVSLAAVIFGGWRPSRGGSVHEQLVAGGFGGSLFPVNPRYEEIRGLPCFADLGQLPAVPDLVVIATPAPSVLPVVESAAALGVRAAVVLGSGFADAGAEGAEMQDRVARVARSGGIALCGPNCYGVINRLDAVSASSLPLPGPGSLPVGGLALLTQSGALSHGVIDFLVRRGAGLGYLLTAGNEAVLDLADYLQAMAADDRVHSVACYVEAIRRPRPFLEALEALVCSGRAVTLLKSGRSEAGRRATAAHTGAVADDGRVWQALLAGAGVVQVQDLGDLAEAAVFALSPAAQSPTRPYLMSFSGAAASVMADLAADAGLELEQPDGELAAAVRTLIPEAGAVANPLDLTGFVADQPARITGVAEAVRRHGAGQLPVMVLNSPAGTTGADRTLYLAASAALAAAAGPSVLGAMVPGDLDAEVRATAAGAGTPVIAGMRTIATVLAARQRAERGLDDHRRAAGDLAGTPAGDLASEVAALPAGFAGEGRAKSLLARAGLASPQRRVAASAVEAAALAGELGFPVVLKVDDPAIPHKAAVGCLALGLGDPGAVERAYADLNRAAVRVLGERPPQAIVVERVAPEGLDCFAGVLRDGDLPPVLALGLGGSLVESGLPAVTLRLPADAAGIARALSRWPLRNALGTAFPVPAAAAETALVEALAAVGRLAVAIGPRLRALDVNPLRLLAAPGGPVLALALDGLVELAAS